MNSEDYRRKAQHFIKLAHHMSRPADRTVMVETAALWKERAEEAEQNERVLQQRQQPQAEEAPSTIDKSHAE